MTIIILIKHFINKYRKYWWLCRCGTYNEPKSDMCIWCNKLYADGCKIEVSAGPTVEI